MPTTTIPGPGIDALYGDVQTMIKKFEPERKAAKEAGIKALEDVVGLFEPGGAMEGVYQKRKKLAMGKAMQGLVSSGLSGTTLPAGISKAWDAGPGIELLMAQMQGTAGALSNLAQFQAETSPTVGNLAYLQTGGMAPFLSGQYGLIGQALGSQQGTTGLDAFGQPFSGSGGQGTVSTGLTSLPSGYSSSYTPLSGSSGLDALNQRYGSITGGGGGATSTGGGGGSGATAVGGNLISDADWSDIQSRAASGGIPSKYQDYYGNEVTDPILRQAIDIVGLTTSLSGASLQQKVAVDKMYNQIKGKMPSG